MAELNDEEALSYAEALMNSFRAVKWMDDLIRYARNCKLDLQQLEPRRQVALEETTKAEAQLSEAQASLQSFLAETAQRREGLTDETSRLESVAQRLLNEVTSLDASKSALGEEFRGLSETIRNQQQKVAQLSETEVSLIQRISGLESRLDELRQAAAKIAG